ncbi:MAG: ATP-dependent DNA helicase [Alphaproteobacteria bacterium]|nr:ATP-dependent DNA helicase [Alphaproteobacteria bacterium]
MSIPPATPPLQPALPRAPVLVAGATRAAWLSSEGEIEIIDLAEAARRVGGDSLFRAVPPILCHGRAVASRLRRDLFPAFDLLELFAFVRPAQFCLPTPRGLAAALDLPPPRGIEGEAAALLTVAERLLAEAGRLGHGTDARAGLAVPVARVMARGGWLWAPHVLAAAGEPPDAPGSGAGGLEVWRRLSPWSDHAPEPPPGNLPVDPAEARERLSQLTGDGAEDRPQQADYASAVTPAFAPRQKPGEPNVVLAEAGTGVGKTLGYIAPASLWAEKNLGPVWISTFTRNLQHQIDGELDRLYPDPVDKALKVVLRKGRENYLCLLNLEEAVGALPTRPRDAVALGLMARWAAATRDGDMVGGDLPGWLPDLIGRRRSLGLADRRGECVYSACTHYDKCFIERSQRRARRADIVVANHALVMIQAALQGGDDGAAQGLPQRYVFDEGHHVFDAADSAFSSHLSAAEGVELRRWLLGVENRRTGRARGLKRRLEDLVAGDEPAMAALDAALSAAHALPGEGWAARLAESRPQGAAEGFLVLVRQQVYARASQGENAYSLETEAKPPVDGLIAVAGALERALARLGEPLKTLRKRLLARLDDEAEELDTSTRLRIEAVARGLQRRGELTVGSWRAMLHSLTDATPPEFVDWFAIERIDGRDADVGMFRHWVDPMVPFTRVVAEPAQGLLITSATLRDGSGDVEADWQAAEIRTGARHLARPALRAAVASPFDYPRQTRVFIVNDLARNDVAQLAAAYRALFLASGGGALGLFTAVARLKAVHQRVAPELEAGGLALYAQHVDGMDTATLIDIFRAEEDACLLGTDAVRDGVDVPGRSLRLIVFDRVPWPRPDILHKARRLAFGPRTYDDMITRLRLKQAFGRLVRRADDRGVFVLLDRQLPSRLLGAFPEGVEVARVGLAEAVAATKGFFANGEPPT